MTSSCSSWGGLVAHLGGLLGHLGGLAAVLGWSCHSSWGSGSSTWTIISLILDNSGAGFGGAWGELGGVMEEAWVGLG